MRYELLSSVNFRQVTDRQTDSDAYEPMVQYAQVGSKIGKCQAEQLIGQNVQQGTN